jgi:metal-dependent amidase/aminoacylase/carboxypeptidase family protein
LRQEARVHGIITDGGIAPNIIPETASCHFYVRAEDLEMLADVKRRVIACAEGAAAATGCRLQTDEDPRVLAPFRVTDPFADIYREQLVRMGLQEDLSAGERNRGSSDIGNVSQLLPTIHPHVPIGAGLHIHTPEFAAATVSPSGKAAIVEGATAMALTAIELCADPAKRAAIKKYFNN